MGTPFWFKQHVALIVDDLDTKYYRTVPGTVRQ